MHDVSLLWYSYSYTKSLDDGYVTFGRDIVHFWLSDSLLLLL